MNPYASLFRHRGRKKSLDGTVPGIERPRHGGSHLVPAFRPPGISGPPHLPPEYGAPPNGPYDPQPGFMDLPEPGYDPPTAESPAPAATPPWRLELPEALFPDPVQVSYAPLAMYELMLQDQREAAAAPEDHESILFDDDVTAPEITAGHGIPFEGPGQVEGTAEGPLEAQDFFDQQMEQLHGAPTGGEPSDQFSAQPASLDAIVEAQEVFDTQLEQALSAMPVEEPMLDPMMMQEMHDEQMMQLMDPFGMPGMGM